MSSHGVSECSVKGSWGVLERVRGCLLSSFKLLTILLLIYDCQVIKKKNIKELKFYIHTLSDQNDCEISLIHV